MQLTDNTGRSPLVNSLYGCDPGLDGAAPANNVALLKVLEIQPDRPGCCFLVDQAVTTLSLQVPPRPFQPASPALSKSALPLIFTNPLPVRLVAILVRALGSCSSVLNRETTFSPPTRSRLSCPCLSGFQTCGHPVTCPWLLLLSSQRRCHIPSARSVPPVLPPCLRSFQTCLQIEVWLEVSR